jgi:excisionase family DNA binding protein
MSSAMKDKETCPRCMHPWDAHTEDVGCTIGHTNHWCQCDSSLRKYLDGVEQTSENRALALIDWETRCAQLEAELATARETIARLSAPISKAEWNGAVYLSAEEVSKRLGISRSSVHRLVRSGKLRAIQISPGTTSSYKIDPASLDEFISELEAK